MVMTVVEAHVEQTQWAALERAYREGTEQGLPPQMVQTFLVQSTDEPTLWRGLSGWRSREELLEMRRSTETPAAILMFRAAGAEPRVSIFTVAASRP